MNVKLISTFSDVGYYNYAKHFVESCIKNIKNVNVVIYKDNVILKNVGSIQFINLEETCPNLVKFKLRNKDRPFKDFRFDAIRFAHKVYATTHAAREENLDYLIWLDADTEIYDTVDPNFFTQFLPKGKFVGFIGRDSVSETGFLIFDMKHPEAKNFFDRYEWYYNTDSLYEQDEYHDGFIFDVVRKEFENSKKFLSHNISPLGVTKNHFNAAFEGFMLHFKGERKEKREEQIAKALRRKNKK